MSLTFSDIVTEIKARSILNESGTEFDVQIKNAINTSIFRISRESAWKNLRRKSTVDTVAEYSTGSGSVSVTNASKSVTITGATIITNGVYTGRRIDLGGSSKNFTIATVTGETTLTLNIAYDGTTSTTQTYKIYGQEEYNLPIQAGRIGLIWHEDYGYPFVMEYITDSDFYGSGITIETGNTPVYWRAWGYNTVINQPRQAGVLRIASSSSSDTSKSVTVFGTVSSYPDYETITTNSSDGTTAVSGSKSFTSVERVSKDSSTTGRITVDADSANTTVAVLPVGDTSENIEYQKIQIFPLPTRVFPLNIQYYKDPWRLVNDSDIHELGYQFDEAIILLASSKVLYSQGKREEGDKFIALYADEVKSLKKFNSDTALDWMPQLRSPKNSRTLNRGYVNRFLSYSQLGGNFGPIWR